METWNVASARAALDLGSWIVAYLSQPEWRNDGLIRRIRDYASVWEGPTMVQLAPLVRIAGPGPEFRFPPNPATWQTDVEQIVARGVDPETMPPLILWRDGENLQIADGNHRRDALLDCGFTQAWAIVSPSLCARAPAKAMKRACG